MKRVMLNEKEYAKLRRLRLSEMDINKDNMSSGEPNGEAKTSVGGESGDDIEPVSETAMYLQSLADYFASGTIEDDTFVPDFLANIKDIVGQYSDEGQIDLDDFRDDNCDPNDPNCDPDEYKPLDQMGDED
jgi:hypothetical protein